MKHIKHINEYNNQNISSTHNINPVYNDNENISELVQNTVSYINNQYQNIDDINDINSNYPEIELKQKQNTEFKKIIINKSSIPSLQFIINKKILPDSIEYQTYPITHKEYEYLKTFFIETKRRKNIDITKNYNAADMINPLKITADKYNL